MACVPSARGATGRGQAGGHVRGAARLRVASSRFAVRSSAVLCGEGKLPLLVSPAGHFRRAVGAAHVRAWTPGSAELGGQKG